MSDLIPTSEIFGAWLGIFLTFAITSFLYKDNPFYKFAEHLFIGVSIGYLAAQQYYNVVEPKVIDRLLGGESTWWMRLLAVVAIILFGMMFAKTVSRRWAWVGRYPIAIIVAMFAALELVGVIQSDLGAQIQRSTIDIDEATEKVDINTAPVEELVLLPGITKPVADAIVVYQFRIPVPVVERKLVEVVEARDILGKDGSLARKAEGKPRKRRFEKRWVFSRFKWRSHRGIIDLDQLEQLPGLTAEQRAQLGAARGGNLPWLWPLRGKLIGLDARASTEPGRNWFALLSELLLLLGMLASLIYFYFSIEQKGPVGRISRAGVWVLMIGFGASFGYTVQGRLALAIGRGIDIMGMDKDAGFAARIHGKGIALASIAIIVIGLVIWERQRKRSGSSS